MVRWALPTLVCALAFLTVDHHAVGYGVYFYLTTPFLLYWLAYASTDQLTQPKLLITVGVVGIYSYIIWDSYFFFQETIQSLISAISTGEFW
jgi:hypothetical protein